MSTRSMRRRLVDGLGTSSCVSCRGRLTIGFRRTVLDLPRGRQLMFGLHCCSRLRCSRVTQILSDGISALGIGCRCTGRGVGRCVLGE